MEMESSEARAAFDVDHLCRNRACVNPDHLGVSGEGIIWGASGSRAEKQACIPQISDE